jgi:hypothetical protein
MARGWESKSVEAQQDERERSATTRTAPPSAEDTERRARRTTIELSLSRMRADLARATSPAYQRSLNQAIAALLDQLKHLQ